jgi:sugar/nucleoside kinase (ribokinase family)
VVVDIVGDANLATEQNSLLGGLELLSTSEETARGNTVLDEGGVVGATAELGGDGVGVVGAEEILKLLLDSTRAGGSSEVESTAITVVDSVDVVGAGNLFIGQVSIFFEIVPSYSSRRNGRAQARTISKLR